MVWRDNTMMRWVEWWNAMKKGDREAATHNSFTTSPSGTAPSQPKVISESGERGSTIPTCLRQSVLTFSPTAESVSRSRIARQRREDSHAKEIKLAAPRGTSSPFVGTELLAGWLAGWLAVFVLRSVTSDMPSQSHALLSSPS